MKTTKALIIKHKEFIILIKPLGKELTPVNLTMLNQMILQKIKQFLKLKEKILQKLY